MIWLGFAMSLLLFTLWGLTALAPVAPAFAQQQGDSTPPAQPQPQSRTIQVEQSGLFVWQAMVPQYIRALYRYGGA